MTQIATVLRMVSSELAEVLVVRQSACGPDCENCSGCGVQGMQMKVLAKSMLPVECGDRVEIHSDNRVLGFAALVYLVPVVLFLTAYLLFPNFSEGVRYLCGGIGFLLGIAAAVICDRMVRKKHAVSYQIIRKI